jgi:peptide/nickel transport system substrate-binding protein
LAGLEANELSWSVVEAKDLQTVKDTGYFQIVELDPTGFTYMQFNMQNAKFADVKVRKALDMAIDKDAMVQVVLSGQGAPLDGPLAPAMIGFDAAAMKGSGVAFDLEAAKALMKEAGYTYGSDGMLLDPDGAPYGFTLLTTPEEQNTKISSLVVNMWKQLGVDVKIEQLEWGTMAPKVFSGDYEICTMGIGWPDADVLYMMYHSSQIGAVNFAFTQDPELDALLQTARTETEIKAHQEAVNAAYKMIQDKAYMVPLFNIKAFYAIGKDFKGVETSPYIGIIYSDMYYSGK